MGVASTCSVYFAIIAEKGLVEGIVYRCLGMDSVLPFLEAYDVWEM